MVHLKKTNVIIYYFYFLNVFKYFKIVKIDNNDKVNESLNKEKDTINDCIKQLKEYDSIIEKNLEINLG